MSRRPTTTAPRVTLRELVVMVGSWCDATDPACLLGADAADAAEQVAMAVRRLQVKQVALAARAESCNSFSGRFPTAAAWQAHINGCSQSEAKRGLDTVERLDACPEVAAALEAGEISVHEAEVVSSAVVVNPGSERRLVDQARKHNFADTRTAADRARNAVFSREQEQARLARMHRLRRVRELTDGDQLAWVDSHVVPDTWVMVRPILDAYTDAEYRTARQQGRRESPDAYRADGLIAALRAAGDAIGITTPTPPRPPDHRGGGGSSDRRGPDRPTGDATGSTSDPGSGPRRSAAGRSTPPIDSGNRSSDLTPTNEHNGTLEVGQSLDPTGTREVADEARPIDQVVRASQAVDGRSVDPITAAEATDPVASTEPIDRSSVRRPRVSSQPVVLVDAIALRRGWATDAETCELARTGTPVSVDWITDLLPAAAVDVLVHDRTDIRAHARVHRRRPRPRTDSTLLDTRPTVVVLIDAIALHHPSPDSDSADGGETTVAVPGTDLRISVSWLRRLVPDEIAAAVERDLIDMRHHTSSTRHLPRPVRLAVLARDRRCTVPGCRNRQGLERDHVHDYAAGGPGDSINMHGTCGEHHDDKTYRDARVVITDTERLWYPPPGRADRPTHGPTPWRAPLGEHLTRWDLRHLPDAGGEPPGGGVTLPFT
jgi:hypothetical protein